jgi:hypothetical protein
MLRTFRGGLLIGLAVAVAVAAGAIIYDRYDARTLDRTVKRGEVWCGVGASARMRRFPCALTAGFPFGTNATIRPKATTSKAVPIIAESSADLDEFMMLFLRSSDRLSTKMG